MCVRPKLRQCMYEHIMLTSHITQKENIRTWHKSKTHRCQNPKRNTNQLCTSQRRRANSKARFYPVAVMLLAQLLRIMLVIVSNCMVVFTPSVIALQAAPVSSWQAQALRLRLASSNLQGFSDRASRSVGATRIYVNYMDNRRGLGRGDEYFRQWRPSLPFDANGVHSSSVYEKQKKRLWSITRPCRQLFSKFMVEGGPRQRQQRRQRNTDQTDWPRIPITYANNEAQLHFDSSETDDNSNNLLSYLDNSKQTSLDLPPKTKRILTEATSLYLGAQENWQDDDDGNLRLRRGIIDALSEEYEQENEAIRDDEFTFQVGTSSYVASSRSSDQADEATNRVDDITLTMGRVLSFAALSRLPFEITLVLLGSLISANTIGDEAPDGSSQTNMDTVSMNPATVRGQAIIDAFQSGGWKAVHFPNGLAVGLKREFLQSSSRSPGTRRFKIILPRRVRRRRHTQRGAVAVLEASKRQAPERQIMSREAILDSMDELSVRSQLYRSFDERRRRLGDAAKDFPFFPREMHPWARKWSVFWERQTKKLKMAGRAGLLSYGVLNFAWYTVALIFSWRRVVGSTTLAASAPAVGDAAAVATTTVVIAADNMEALQMSLKRFVRVLAAVYIGSQVTKLPCLLMAVLLAPLGDRMLRMTQRKLDVSEARAFWLLTAALLTSCVGIWTAIVLGDAALSSLGTFNM